MVYKIVHEAFINHNKVLANTIDNVMKEVSLERQLIRWDHYISIAIILQLLEAVCLVLVSC
jgi:hypothetical protein